MRTTTGKNKIIFGNIMFLFMLPLFLVLSSFGTAHAKDKHTITVKNSASFTYCEVSVQLEDGSSTMNKIYPSLPVKWESKQCVTKISARCFDTAFWRTISSITTKICENATYEIKWVDSANAFQFVKD